MTSENIPVNCENNINFCEVRTHNFFKIPQTQKIMPPSSINFVDASSRTRKLTRRERYDIINDITGRKSKTTVTYEITLKSGKTIYVGNGTANETIAKNICTEINKCLANKNFPCRYKL